MIDVLAILTVAAVSFLGGLTLGRADRRVSNRTAIKWYRGGCYTVDPPLTFSTGSALIEVDCE